jgi:hypothetical protein
MKAAAAATPRALPAHASPAGRALAPLVGQARVPSDHPASGGSR